MEELIKYALMSVLGVVAWLLKNKDAHQANEIADLRKQIENLNTLHIYDAKKLEEFRLEIAKEHYLKHELDSKFYQLEQTFKDGFSGLGNKFDKMTETLIKYMMKDSS